MIDKDYIKDLFQEKLSSYEVPVRPDIWTSVSSSIGGSSVLASGITIASKIIIALSIAVGAVATVYLINRETVNQIPLKNEKIQDQTPIISEPQKIEKIEKTENITLPIEIKQIQSTAPSQEKDLIVNLGTTEIKNTKEKNENILDKNVVELEQKQPIIQKNATSKTEIITKPESTTKENESTILLPNIFTPNGDDKNDFLSIKIGEVTEFSVVILNQANKVIFTSNDPNFSWDGIAKNGELSPAGSYVYYISAKDLNGKLLTKYSSLTISY